jgi:penicillin amidase
MNLPRLFLRLALGRRLPITSGELRVQGLRAAITIRRDEYGVAHIEAENDHDALYAIGFSQGQDRAAQLEFLWRIGRGRLAEWVGKAGVGADRMSRRIGFRRAAERQVASLSGWIHEHMTAFAAGITAGATTGLTAKPHEFALVGGKPSAWDVTDVLSLLKLQSFLLPSNWDVEVARLRILLADGPESLLALDPAHNARITAEVLSPHHPFTPSPLLESLAADLAALQACLPRGGGSNNWVIHGSRTQSGMPLLASDPHLAPSAPPPWYLLHIRTPEWAITGAFLTGSPGVAIGHNGFCAWGVTAGLTDNTDLFVETLGPDGKCVRQPDGSFAACEVIRETIRVKDGPDVMEEVLVTPRGPIVSPLFPGMPVALAMRAVWLDPLPVSGFLGLPRVRSFEAFRRSFAEWPLLPLNVLYADVEGKTGYQLIGTLPRRRSGTGLVPRPADRADSDWDGYVPFEEMPFIENPGPGYFSTANNPVPGRPELGADYCDDYRHRAVTDALALGEKWSAEQCLALQLDVRCIAWEEIRDIVLGLPATSVEARDGVELLRGWDGRLDSESPAACVFELFMARMCQRVAQAKAPREWLTVLGENGLGGAAHTLFTDRRIGHLVRLIRAQPDGWFSSWSREIESALGEVVRKLRREVGPAPAYWAWGHVRRLRLEHPLFGKHRLLATAFNLGPVPCGGDCNTVSQAGVRPADPTDFTHNMCNMRTVFDLADLGASRFVLCGGQSGNPWSAHHADQLPLWQEGESITIPWEQADVIRAAKETLRLLPSGDRGQETGATAR